MTAGRVWIIWFVIWMVAWLVIGCSRVQYVDRPVEVKVPVYEPCEVQPPPPLRPITTYITKDASDFEKIKAILVERREMRRQEEILRDMLAVCTAGPR